MTREKSLKGNFKIILHALNDVEEKRLNRRITIPMSLLFLALALAPILTASATTASRTKTVYFPSASDTWSIAHYPYMWTQGDYIEGTRDLGRIALLKGMAIHMVLSYNVLKGNGEIDIDVYINGNKVGSLAVLAGMTTVDASFTFKMFCKGGVVTIKYLETNTVASEYGSITISSTASTVAFEGFII
jgi:hypothetical protein